MSFEFLLKKMKISSDTLLLKRHSNSQKDSSQSRIATGTGAASNDAALPHSIDSKNICGSLRSLDPALALKHFHST
jgi:hypothetical protein